MIPHVFSLWLERHERKGIGENPSRQTISTETSLVHMLRMLWSSTLSPAHWKSLNHLAHPQMPFQRMQKGYKTLYGRRIKTEMLNMCYILMTSMWNVRKMTVFKPLVQTNQRHVHGTGLAQLVHLNTQAWYLAPDMKNLHGLLESSHSTPDSCLLIRF